MRQSGETGRSTSATGACAERLGERFLGARGLRVVARNFRTRAGEIDLVMLDGRQLVAVEIRYRARAGLVDPAATVTAAKRRRLLRAMAGFLQQRPHFRDHALRFDVLALSGPFDALRCDWIRGAFTADDVART
jgi:putative endonuclease